MNRSQNKKKIFALLQNHQWNEIEAALLKCDPKDCISPFFAALCNPDEILKWHAVSGFGVVVHRIARSEMEEARIVMRRLLWSLNDESGGIGWGAPEAMAEIMAGHDDLFEEYCHMLLSYMGEDGPESFQDGNYLELPALQQGLLWGIGRLLCCRTEEMLSRGVKAELPKYLNSSDRIVQGLAAWCLGMCRSLDSALHIDELERLSKESFTFKLYWNHALQEVCVASLARQALDAIQANS
ncbi:MAG: DVU0298 family protein [Desulfopila sp.]